MAAHGYLFVYETLLNQMESHLLTPGMQLPSEMELAQELGVSRMTARKALTRLEEENRIFRRFYRGKRVTTQAGFGIGLYLAREIVSLHGGFLLAKRMEPGLLMEISLPVQMDESFDVKKDTGLS